MKLKSASLFRVVAIIFPSIFLAAFASRLLAAACCGGGFAAPSMVAGDDKAQLTASLSEMEIVVDSVDSRGVWREWDHHQKIRAFRLEGAHVFEDRWQTGFALPVIQRAQRAESYSGLGDVSVSLGYEYLTDWDYNPYRPKGIGYAHLTLPTGKSKAESINGGLDSRGNGTWALGFGSLLTKAIGNFDFFVSVEGHRSFPKMIESPDFSGRIEPGFGGQWGGGFGYNSGDVRFGSSLNWYYEDSVDYFDLSGNRRPSGVERYATATANVSYLYDDMWSGTLALSDQTLFGSPINTSLGRGISLSIQRRWSR